MLQAFATLRVYDAKLLEAARKPLLTFAVAKRLAPAPLAASLAAYAVFLYRDAGFLHVLQRHFWRTWSKMTDLELAQSVWAMVSLGVMEATSLGKLKRHMG